MLKATKARLRWETERYIRGAAFCGAVKSQLSPSVVEAVALRLDVFLCGGQRVKQEAIDVLAMGACSKFCLKVDRQQSIKCVDCWALISWSSRVNLCAL